MRGEEIRLVEIEANAAIERRPSRVRACQARAAEKVHVVILGVDAPFLFRPVADAKVDPLMFTFGHGDANRHLGRLTSGLSGSMLANWNSSSPYSRRCESCSSRPLIQVAALEGQLTFDDARADGLVALNLDRADMRQLAGFRGKRQRSPFGRLGRASSVVSTLAYG